MPTHEPLVTDISLTRMLKLLEGFDWNKAQSHPVGNKKLLLKTAPIHSSVFWELYRPHKFGWFDALGISVEKRGHHWFVKWWADESGEFTTKENGRRTTNKTKVSATIKADSGTSGIHKATPRPRKKRAGRNG